MNPNYYNCKPLPKVLEESYWSENETDYEKHQNLILGLPQRIETEFPIPDSLQTEYFNTSSKVTILTDGKKGSLNYKDEAWFHFSGGVSRAVYFDLNNISEITGFRMGFLNDASLWIHPPRSIRFEASIDGVEWEVLSKETNEFDKPKQHRFELDIVFDNPRKARFVKIFIPIGPHTYIDEIEVFGTKKVSDAALDIVPTPIELRSYPNKFASPDELGGVNNIILTYTCSYPNTRRGRHSAEDLLPYVAYHDENNNITDTFFDSFLFLPCTSKAPSGENMQAGNLIFSDWQYYIDDQYADESNIPGLEKAASIVKEKLNLEDFKLNVFLSILMPMKAQRDFGDIDGSGKSLDFANVEDRKKAIKWEIDEQLKRFNDSDFEHLKLWGFYWYEESINGDDDEEMEILNFTNDYIRSLGYKSIWIPYYQAQGFHRWSEFGFDAACLQPNYMFNHNATENRVYECADLAKKLGMCVEMEIDSRSLTQPEWRARYIAYLRGGVKTGYMKEGIKMYYQEAVPGIFYSAYKSEDPLIRAIYDNTYLFSKNNLTEEIIDSTMF